MQRPYNHLLEEQPRATQIKKCRVQNDLLSKELIYPIPESVLPAVRNSAESINQ